MGIFIHDVFKKKVCGFCTFFQNSQSWRACFWQEVLLYFCFIDYAKAFDCVHHNKLWKILQEMGLPDHLICLLRNVYAGQKQQLELDMEQQTGSK